MRMARLPHHRLHRLLISSTIAAAAIGAVTACTASEGGSQASVQPAALTPTASAKFVTPSLLTSEAMASSSASPTPNATASLPDESSAVATTITVATSAPTATAVDGSAPDAPPSLRPEVTAPTDPEEIAGREAVEAAWIRFWDCYPTFEELSPAQRIEIAEATTVDPLRTQILQGAANADASGETGYGTVSHRISWYQSIDGQREIALADCMDQSQAGTSERASGKKLTKGLPRENLIGDLVYDDAGGWRVRNIFYQPDDVPC